MDKNDDLRVACNLLKQMHKDLTDPSFKKVPEEYKTNSFTELGRWEDVSYIVSEADRNYLETYLFPEEYSYMSDNLERVLRYLREVEPRLVQGIDHWGYDYDSEDVLLPITIEVCEELFPIVYPNLWDKYGNIGSVLPIVTYSSHIQCRRSDPAYDFSRGSSYLAPKKLFDLFAESFGAAIFVPKFSLVMSIAHPEGNKLPAALSSGSLRTKFVDDLYQEVKKMGETAYPQAKVRYLLSYLDAISGFLLGEPSPTKAKARKKYVLDTWANHGKALLKEFS